MKDKKVNLELEAVKLLVLTSKKFSLYSKRHPIVKQHLSQLFENYKQLLAANPKITISLRGESLFFNETALPERTLRAQELIAKLKELEIESISFSLGLELSELENLIFLLGTGRKLDENEQKLKDNFLGTGFAHIQANVIHYERVEEGQEVTSATTKEAELFLKEKEKASEVTPKDDALGIFSKYLAGEVGIEVIAKYKEDIVSKLMSNPAEVAKVIMRSALASKSLQHSFEILQESIIDEFSNRLIQKKRKSKRILSTLERNITKAIDAEPQDSLLKNQKKDLAQIIEGFSDNLKINILTKLFETARLDVNKFLRRSKGLLSDIEELPRLTPRLKSAFMAKGLKEEDWEILLARFQDRLEVKKKISISEREYEQLKNKAELFDKTLIERVAEATEELKKKNKRLTGEKERVDTVIRNLADGLIVVDKEGKVVMINPAAQELLGIKGEKKIGSSLIEGANSHQLISLTKGNLADEGESVSKEIELKTKDEQTKRILRASSAVVENENGNTVGMVMTLSDVTRERQLDKMKSDFVAHVSHELRTPIVATQKSLSLLLSKAAGEINENQHKFLSIANSNLTRLARLINDILDFSKIEAGKIRVEPKAFNFNELIGEITQSLVTWAGDKQIELICDLGKEEIEIQADRDRIAQVLTNLVSNALKFTPQKGKVTVSCKTISEMLGGERKECVQVSVTDNGMGIEEKDCQRIFDKFEQVSLISPAGIGGTGLGLYICKEIIEMHRGQIWVDSEIEKGSTFSFTLPKKFSQPAVTPDEKKD